MIARIITFIVIIIFFMTGLLMTITISTNTQPVKYSMYNELDYNWNVTYPTYINAEIMPIMNLADSYDLETAKYCMDLVSRVELNQTIIPHIPLRTEFLSTMNMDKVFSVVWDSENIIWVVFRGSWNLYEWINNFRIQQTSYYLGNKTFNNMPSFMENNQDIMIHSGFVKIYDELRKGILESIEAHKGDNVKICVTGHSLGGAIANICGLDLKTLGYDAQVYSFASPRVGNIALAETMASSGLKHYRIINTEDTIPQMPLPVSPNFSKHDNPYFYIHNGIEYRFTNPNKSIFVNHSTRTYVNNINNIEIQ
jgi:hypothetical protein